MKLDDIVRNIGVQNQGQTPTQQPSDNLSSQRSFYDHVINSIEYHDSKIRQKFKKLEFPGVVLRSQAISDIELMERTSLTFAKDFYPLDKQEKIYEVFVHIPEISGLLPQPSIREMFESETPSIQSDFQRKKYNMLTSRYPRFYIVAEEPKVFEVWKVKFPDENFFYYGTIESKIQNSSMIKRDPATQRAKRQLDKFIKDQSGVSGIPDGMNS